MEDKNIKKINIFTYFCLALALVSTVSYMLYAIITSSDIVNQIVGIISSIVLAIFSILYVIMGLFAQNKGNKVFIIIGSLLLAFYSLFQIIVGIIPKDYVLDFTNKDIKEVVYWAEERDILIEQEFKNSDTVTKYKVISQSIKEGTSTKRIKKITVVVSDGPNENIETDVTSMIGWKLDDVIKYIDDNHLTNVNILFEFNNKINKDIIFDQDIKDVIKRNQPITLKSSLGKETDIKNVTMDNLVGLDIFHALIYLKRNNLNYTIQYGYSEDKLEGTVIKQSIKKWDIVNPKTDSIIITVARNTGITVPDLTKLSATEINTWITENRLKVEFVEEYDDNIKVGKVIYTSPTKGNTVEIGNTIKVVLSKGQIRMIAFTNVDDFKTWAAEHEIGYNIEYQFSNTVDAGKLIFSSHSVNQLIKNTDTVNLIISQGGNTIIPNLIGMSKENALSSCSNAKIKCILTSDTGSKVIKQSMRSGSNVPVQTTVTLTLGE